MIKVVTLAFCSIQQYFIRDIRPKFGIPNLPQSLDIGQNSAGGISEFRISGQIAHKRKFMFRYTFGCIFHLLYYAIWELRPFFIQLEFSDGLIF